MCWVCFVRVWCVVFARGGVGAPSAPPSSPPAPRPSKHPTQQIGGVMIMGDRGTGKSTTIRALADLLPEMRVVDKDPFNSGAWRRMG